MRVGFLRISYSIFTVGAAFAAYSFSHLFVNDRSNALDTFSYIGTVATLIGLIITICEIIHNISVSKSIKAETFAVVDRVKRVENASTVSECLAALDDVNSAISSNNYVMALKIFQLFRKLCLKTGVVLESDPDENNIGILNSLEQKLMSATHSTDMTPLSPVQKSDLTKKTLVIKESIEKANPANGGSNAPT